MPVPDLRRRWLPPVGIAALVALTILDVVLIRLAFDHVDTPEAPTSRTTPAASLTPDEPSPSTSASPSESAPAASLPAGPIRLALASDGTVLRAVAGDCAEGTEPQVAAARPGADRLRTLTVAADLAEVLDVRADARNELVVIGADAECEVNAYLGSGRRAWSTTSADDEWYLDTTADPAVVHAPGGAVEVPCVPVALSTLDAIRVLCDGGAIVGTGDGGESWVALGRLEDASAMAFQGPGRGVALARTDDCPVALLSTSNGGAAWESTSCLEGNDGRAVALRGDAVVAVVDDVLWASGDGGETWVRRGRG